MINIVDLDKLGPTRINRVDKYREAINEFLESGAEAAEVILPDVPIDTLYRGIRYAVGWSEFPVIVVRRDSRVYLKRKRTVDAGTSNGPEQKGSV